MRLRHLASVSLLAVALAACSADDILDVKPEDRVPADVAITDAVSARAAVAGLYDALQSGSYYGESFLTFEDLSSDNASHTGTFSSYAQADKNQLTSDNTTVASIWSAIYRSIGRANAVIERVPQVTELDAETRDQYLAEAYFVRALGHHNATKLWGDVPIITSVITVPSEAAQVTRSPASAVYTQILSDLDKAEQLVQDDASTTKVSLGAILALRARVLLYQKSYAAAEAAANKVIAMGYELASSYSDLFTATGNATTEDIFRLAFNDQDSESLSYYYVSKSYGGRRELGPTSSIRNAFEPGDQRYDVTIAVDPRGRYFVAKYPSITGTEHIHVIRFAEVLLIKAEAQARQGKLAEALATLNLVRERAGLAALTLGTKTQQQVIDAIVAERRVELAFEGDRWSDLVRVGTAATVMGIPSYQMLYPVPQSELDVAAGLTQNAGY